ncbi:MAG: polysaccharide biosynthesis/export family protein [Phycisphaerae bacterium]|nr:polysaccharide biosynthesis/export family protein [Phycisphaerae bacterium]
MGSFPLEYQERGIRRVLTPRDMPAGPANAVEPTPEDLVPVYDDYRVVVADQIQVVIEDLISQGLQEASAQLISNTGYIRIPLLGSLKIVGMTEAEIEQDIIRRLQEGGYLSNPIVRVTVTSRRAWTYSILGSVSRAGTYPISEPDLRLLDVIGLAGDIGAEVRRMYVIRRTSGGGAFPDGGDAPAIPDEGELIVPPPSEEEDWSQMPVSGAVLASGQVVMSGASFDEETPDQDTLEEIISPTPDQSVGEKPERAFEPRVFDPVTGELVDIEPEPAEPPMPEVERGLEQPGFEWEDVPDLELSQRVIEIDVRALKSGDPRYNILVRPKDVINIPIDTGVFYMMGEINRPGVFAFGGREITIKQAIAMVGGFSVLAWPQRCEIIRREPGTDTQTTIPVNVDAIFAGLEDDVLLRDEDIVNVGTHIVSPFLFVIRNSFRFTYGFGFVYDRNFADVDSYSSKANPDTIKRQEKLQQGLSF